MNMYGEDYAIVDHLVELADRGRMVLSDEFYDGATNKRIDEWMVTVVADKSGQVVIAHHHDLLECLHKALLELEE